MNRSTSRRLIGAAAFSAGAIVSLLAAPEAQAEPAGPPPGISQACAAQDAYQPDSAPGAALGPTCTPPPDGGLYNWWKKT
jgi:hypothetical protein